MIGLGLTLALGASPNPAWWPAGAIYAADFVNNRYMRDGRNVAPEEAYSLERSTPALMQDRTGLWREFGPHTLRRINGIGAMLESATTNVIGHPRAIENWNIRGTAAVSIESMVARADGTPGARLVSGIANGPGGDVFIYATATADTRCEPSLMLKRVSTQGILSIANPMAGEYGLWTLDLAQLPDGWTRITRENAAVTVVEEFVTLGTGCGLHLRNEIDAPITFSVDFAQLEMGEQASTAVEGERSADLYNPPIADWDTGMLQLSDGTVAWAPGTVPTANNPVLALAAF
jgi:hypothetical protein